MAKKRTQVSEEELKTVEGLAGAKVGLGIAARMEMLKSRYAIIPAAIGSAVSTMFVGPETEEKIKDAIISVKEASVNKAEVVFNKISKCKSKKKMVKKASLLGMAAKASPFMLPKPRTTAMDVTNVQGKNIEMKKMINIPKK